VKSNHKRDWVDKPPVTGAGKRSRYLKAVELWTSFATHRYREMGLGGPTHTGMSRGYAQLIGLPVTYRWRLVKLSAARPIDAVQDGAGTCLGLREVVYGLRPPRNSLSMRSRCHVQWLKNAVGTCRQPGYGSRTGRTCTVSTYV